jgi:hypothetical protein
VWGGCRRSLASTAESMLAVIWLWKPSVNRVSALVLGGVRVLSPEPCRVSWMLGFGPDLLLLRTTTWYDPLCFDPWCDRVCIGCV